jgi:hypothetical protein
MDGGGAMDGGAMDGGARFPFLPFTLTFRADDSPSG